MVELPVMSDQLATLVSGLMLAEYEARDDTPPIRAVASQKIPSVEPEK